MKELNLQDSTYYLECVFTKIDTTDTLNLPDQAALFYMKFNNYLFSKVTSNGRTNLSGVFSIIGDNVKMAAVTTNKDSLADSLSLGGPRNIKYRIVKDIGIVALQCSGSHFAGSDSYNYKLLDYEIKN